MSLKNISLAKNSELASLSSSKHLSHKARPGASKQSIACLASSKSKHAPGSNAFENRPIPCLIFCDNDILAAQMPMEIDFCIAWITFRYG